MMASLTIEIDYLTGRCVAASVANRDQPEWPPHPGRLFMALAAACFERGEDPEEVAALEWLEKQGVPNMRASAASVRSLTKCYVPVNDKMTVNKAVLQSTPGLTRSKQERSYPTVIPDATSVYYVWPNVTESEPYLSALQQVCGETIRVGHSSSLVRAWAYLGEPKRHGDDSANSIAYISWKPTDELAQQQARVADIGELSRLRRACGVDRIERFVELQSKIDGAKGKEKKAAQQEFEADFRQPYKTSLRPPEPTPPVLGTWQGYRRSDAESETVAVGEHYDSTLTILSKLDGRNLGLSDCLALTQRLRETVLNRLKNPIPEWVSGHQPDGSPTQFPHLAFVPLPYVGSQHADGHLLGLALVLPNRISPRERGKVLSPLLFKEGNRIPVELLLGRLGEWTLDLEARPAPPLALQNETWTRASRDWASVTPVVLDRFPKQSRSEDRAAWEAEVARTIAAACKHAGLPRPVNVFIDKTSVHQGVPRAVQKTRKVRGAASRESSPLGDGFPIMPTRAGKPARPQVHVHLQFEQPVRGPVLIGAGRYFGYGFCKPLSTRNKR
ncbi:type I-G CRISPR-associated protein Csb2 [Bremerella alba]|uniref:Type I-U CRISPR-associated protein Cas5/Cas6 n=1 Tax=Bremerella alba TaxID=980252 RepID=A0A7V8V4U8_9BACT|nr:type I-U CRISPR-associated protein Csb2 [Bremerella alba]MBA2114993.1 hypothetical protein [Bremerella alba]